MNVRGKTVLVVGTKRSGMGAIELLAAAGAKVRAMDAGKPGPEETARLAALQIPVLAQTADHLTTDLDLIVLSPAVPFDLPMWNDVRQRGVTMVGEVELASYFLQGPVAGITGSNGKTTTTALTGHLFANSGIACQVGGNIGTAVTALIESSRPEQWNVLELSSFQLEATRHFRVQMGACLNVTPDHLDRHHTFERYAAAKGRLFENQQQNDWAVLNYEDRTCRESYAEIGAGRKIWFSSRQQVPAGAWLDGNNLLLDGDQLVSRPEIKLRGLHNVENILAASLMAHLAGATRDQITAAIRTFSGVEHRIEFVREHNGVGYYNDSKATNVDATLKAIDAFEEPLWIILGGKHKGGSYEPLVEPLRRKAKAALLIGEPPPYPYAASPLIASALGTCVPVLNCRTISAALQHAKKYAIAGDIVLLAPACASFDQFENYEHRGRAFKQLVAELF